VDSKSKPAVFEEDNDIYSLLATPKKPTQKANEELRKLKSVRAACARDISSCFDSPVASENRKAGNVEPNPTQSPFAQGQQGPEPSDLQGAGAAPSSTCSVAKVAPSVDIPVRSSALVVYDSAGDSKALQNIEAAMVKLARSQEAQSEQILLLQKQIAAQQDVPLTSLTQNKLVSICRWSNGNSCYLHQNQCVQQCNVQQLPYFSSHTDCNASPYMSSPQCSRYHNLSANHHNPFGNTFQNANFAQSFQQMIDFFQQHGKKS